MDKNKLYAEKGDLITNIEILQGKLKEVNKDIMTILMEESNKQKELIATTIKTPKQKD